MRLADLLLEATKVEIEPDALKLEPAGAGQFKVIAKAGNGAPMEALKNFYWKNSKRRNCKFFTPAGKPAANIPSSWPRWFMVHTDFDEARMKELVDDIVSRTGRDIKREIAYKEKKNSPAEKRKLANFNYEQQKKRKEELYAKYGKDVVEAVKIQSMSHEGDDGYQWALFKNGRRVKSGMTRSQAEGEQRLLWADLAKFNKMTPEEQAKHLETLQGLKLYFELDAFEKAVKANTDEYLAAVQRNAKAFVASANEANEAISKAKAKEILDKFMVRISRKEG